MPRLASLLSIVLVLGCGDSPTEVTLLPVTARNLNGQWIKTFTKIQLAADPSVEINIPTIGVSTDVWEFRALDMVAVLRGDITRSGIFSTAGDSIFIEIGGSIALRMSAELTRDDMRVVQTGFRFDFDGDGVAEDALGAFLFRRR